MREIHTHKINPANDLLKLEAADKPGAGGANHHYEITGFDLSKNPSYHHDRNDIVSRSTTILFQNGPIAEAGINGLTHEVLLAILIDRLQSFQSGTYACRENALALTKLEEAQHWLHHRTLSRIARGVEGTSKK
jgi:hypothetical protein